MLNIKFIRENYEIVQEAANNKGIKMDIQKLLKLDKIRRTKLSEIEKIQKRRNEVAKEIVIAKDKQVLIDEGKILKLELARLEESFKSVKKQYDSFMYRVPNVPSEDTPIGTDESQNVPTKYYGKKPEFDFEIKDHIQLGEEHDLVDFKRGVKVHGFRGYFLKNELAAMHLGLMMHSLKIMMKHGYTPTIVPSIVKGSTMWNSGEFPFGDNIFEVKSTIENTDEKDEKEKLYLAGTAEVALVSMHAGETLDLSNGPKKYVGFSPCYRSEVGSYGKDTKGMYRVHEFMKVEQVVICENDYKVSTKLQDEMMSISHEILDTLGLHYRDLSICTGDMGAGKYRMFDIETWMPARGSYGETHSASNIGEWQARRANIKYKTKDGNKEYVHMLNNTSLASPRVLIAILETYQQKDGSIKIPDVLVGYVGKEYIGR